MFIKMPEYEILIREDGLQTLKALVRKVNDVGRIFVITDRNVDGFYHEKLCQSFEHENLEFVIIEPGEKQKSLDSYHVVIKKLLASGIKRDDLILAFGGGVVGDLAGFVAATLYRGIDYVQIPTTLLAQVDSSIGSKVAIDLPEGKNLIGSFYPPKLVIVDPTFLHTLPEEEIANGIAEMIKAGLIFDKKLYQKLLTNQEVTKAEIIDALLVKRDLVLLDPFDKKERMFLNFGHTFGHAIEKAHHYEIYSHGQAISYGMLFALELGCKWGKTDPAIYHELKALLLKLKLVKEPLLEMKDYIPYVWGDKKNSHSGLRFIILTHIGHPEVVTISERDLL